MLAALPVILLQDVQLIQINESRARAWTIGLTAFSDLPGGLAAGSRVSVQWTVRAAVGSAQQTFFRTHDFLTLAVGFADFHLEVPASQITVSVTVGFAAGGGQAFPLGYVITAAAAPVVDVGDDE